MRSSARHIANENGRMEKKMEMWMTKNQSCSDVKKRARYQTLNIFLLSIIYRFHALSPSLVLFILKCKLTFHMRFK